MKNSSERNSIVSGNYWIGVAGAWLLIIAGLCANAIMQSRVNIIENALLEARTNIDMDIAYRKWVAEKGGVYVRPSESTPSNPYLNVPHRDVKTTDGTVLTLVNPAYMTRQVHEYAAKLYGVKAHLTSLKPIRPENSPAPWERASLRKFEEGAKEVSEEVDIDGKPHVRLMRAFITEKFCLKCHASQGYAEGDVRGGISVTVPLEKYFTIYRKDRNGTLIRYGIILLIGLSGIWFLKRSLERNSTSLRESEERFRKLAQEQSVILETSPAGISLMKNRVVQMANFPFDSLLGYERGETLGKSTLEFYPDRGTYESIGTEAYATIARGVSYSTDVKMRRKDGTLFWAELSGHAITPGNPDDASIWMIQDISRRKFLEEQTLQDAARLESLLRISQLDYSSVQELFDYALHEAITLTKSKLGYIYFYDEKTRSFTLNTWSDEVMNECRIDKQQRTYALDDKGLWGEAVRQRRTIVVNDFSAPNPMKKGYPEGHAPLHSFMTIPLFNKESIVAVVGVANKDDDYSEQDIRQLTLMMEFVWKMAEQAHTELELQASEKRYRQLLESIQLMATILDVDGTITFCNDHFLKVTGYTHEDVIGLNMPDRLVPESERDSVRSSYQAVIGSKTGMQCENRIITRNGDIRQIVWNRTPVFDARGTVMGIASIGIDVTDHRTIEEQFRQSQKMEAIGQLAGGVAHDFNNILTVISGYCGLLQRDASLAKEVQHGLAEIAAAVDRATQLIQGLLAFSRKQPLMMRCDNLNDIIQNVHTFLARVIGEDITFNSTCCGTELPILADRGQIEQVLINLATNARDAMQLGGIFSIKSELSIIDSSFTDAHKHNVAPGAYALLTISDTGAGIGREHIDRIFEPFFTTKGVGKGTGLGLAIIYGIIKQHNGFINVYSEPGQGTTFRIYLPIQQSVDSSPDYKAMTVLPQGGNETVMIAEDDPSVRSLASTILTSYGYETILAEDGEDAIEKFMKNQEKIALILMDIIMPKKNGIEALTEIKRVKPDVKVLFSSGYTADFIEGRGISEAGMEIIMKPVQPMELLIKIRHMLDSGMRRAE